MADLETGNRLLSRLLKEGRSVLLELLQNVMLFQKLNGLQVPVKFKLLATALDTDG